MGLHDKTASAIRQSFLDYFRGQGHAVVPSASLVPQNDPTLMFVNAGMVPFKDVFTGSDKRDYKRATSSQKCIRISGKHNDLENVGVTARHHTFFEMLGNFSFGDYFKEDAIAFAWEYLTKVVDLPADRLVITVFNGEGGLPADDEAAGIWRKVTGFGDDRILRLGKDDNFWSMGDTGPCGPCSEIHFFHGEGAADVSRFGEEPRIDGLGWTEIWNLVFMQFNRPAKDAQLIALPAPSIDTGMGLERISCAVQGVTSNYDTDLLRSLVDLAAEISGKTYRGTTGDDDVSMRVIADHARTTAFLIAEGVMPDRAFREYVLRRVMRRAIRHGQRLGIERPFLHEVALRVVDHMGDTYPELKERRGLIARVAEDEEVRFRITLKRGLKMIDERFAAVRERGEHELAPEVAADLYTTYGFPLDLTEVICRESGFSFDFKTAEKLTKGEGAAGPIDEGAALDPIYHQIKTEVGSVAFTGYEHEEGESEVLAIAHVTTESAGEKKLVRRALESSVSGPADVEVVVKITPFYAESGGQVGDQGVITTASGARIVVRDTQRPVTGLIVHQGVLEAGTIAKGDHVKLAVDHGKRLATRRNHSATHLLHWALKKVLGEHAMQKGSRVGPDVLRFDFAHNKPLSREDVTRIEDLVNGKILTNEPVLTEVIPIDDAKKRGAVAIFEEKYGDVVRMLTMTRDSIELCGGTHVRALGDIGMFKIDAETSVAAGVRRLFASTGTNALEHVREGEGEMLKVRQLVKAQGADLVDKVSKLVQRERELEKKIAELEKKILEGGTGPGNGIDAMLSSARDIAGVKVLAAKVADGTNAGALRELAEKLRDKLGDKSAVCLGTVQGDKAQICIMVSKLVAERAKAGDLVREVAKKVGGSGGGRPDMAQAGGANIAGLGEALDSFYAEVEGKLTAS
ncbi:MAG: alanine--tRNA ligase [Polyangiaceae bacterium]|nr:alanine--tRNA ligase [Polyangiaceae bacterium]